MAAPLIKRFARVLAYALPHWPTLAATAALSIVASALTALQPWPLKILVDCALGGQALPESLRSAVFDGVAPSPRSLLVLAALATLAIVGVNALIDGALTLAWSRAGQRMVYRLAGDLFLQLQRLSLLFHARRSIGDSLSRVTGDAWCVYTVSEGALVTPVRQLMVLVSVGMLAWQLDQRLALIMLSIVPLLAFFAFHFGALLKRTERRRREAGARVSSFVHQALDAMPLVQAFGAGARNLRIFDSLAHDEVRATRAGAVLINSYTMLNGIATTLAVAIVVYAGGTNVLRGEMTLGSLLVFIAYIRSLEVACRNLLRSYGSLRTAEASVERVLEVLDAQEMVRDAPGAVALPAKPRGRGVHVVLDRVTFGYEPERPVLRELSLDIRSGETVALVGATGSGKTTVASLVLRFFDPWYGRVLFDGVDVRRATVASLRSELALVLQDPFILPLTAAENVCYGKPNASRDEIVAAAVAADAHEFIRSLPQGYDTVLGEQGSTLSGGQRQRIAIARALLKDPRLLILDEPTSALDAATERQVMAALTRLMAGRTTLIIAHRLTTVRNADRIAVLEEGRVVELGTHVELLALGGRYARLYALSAFGASSGAVDP